MNEGDMVSHDIKLVRVLGRGAMGSVWIADHLGHGQQVAVKFLSASCARDPSLLLRFQREAQVALQIESPHVVRIFGTGIVPGGLPYIVMELLEGESLGARLDDEGRLSLELTCTVVRHLCHALGAAHDKRIIHRDIKPANIFLMESDGTLCVKLLDFGVAKDEATGAPMATQTGDYVGTPFYTSPEQLFSAKHVDCRADLWSLAVVAYVCLTGELPFKADAFWEFALAVRRGIFAPPSGLRPELAPPVDAWFERALHAKLAQRFGSAAQMAEELERAAGG